MCMQSSRRCGAEALAGISHRSTGQPRPSRALRTVSVHGRSREKAVLVTKSTTADPTSDDRAMNQKENKFPERDALKHTVCHGEPASRRPKMTICSNFQRADSSLRRSARKPVDGKRLHPLREPIARRRARQEVEPRDGRDRFPRIQAERVQAGPDRQGHRVALEAEVKRNERSRDESRILAQKVALRRRKSSML